MIGDTVNIAIGYCNQRPAPSAQRPIHYFPKIVSFIAICVLYNASGNEGGARARQRTRANNFVALTS